MIATIMQKNDYATLYVSIVTTIVATSLVSSQNSINIYFVHLEDNQPYSDVRADESGLIRHKWMVEYGFMTHYNEYAKTLSNTTINTFRHHKRFRTSKQLEQFILPNETRTKKDLCAELNTDEIGMHDLYLIGVLNRLVNPDKRFFVRVKLFISKKHVLVVPTKDILLSNQFLNSIGHCLNTIIVAVICAVDIAAVIWLLEHRSNPDFQKDFGPGLLSSVWFCLVTMTTVGYGDKVPKHLLSRIICLGWMLFGLVLTAFITTNLMEAVSKGMKKDGKVIASNQYTAGRHIIKNELNSKLHKTSSYKEALNLVKTRQVSSALVDSNVAAYYLANNDPEGILKIESEYDVTIAFFAYLVLHDQHPFRSKLQSFSLKENLLGDISMEILKNKFVPSYTVYPYYLRSVTELFTDSDPILTSLFFIACFLLLIAALSEVHRWRLGVKRETDDARTMFEGTEECQRIREMERQLNELISNMLTDAKQKFNNKNCCGKFPEEKSHANADKDKGNIMV